MKNIMKFAGGIFLILGLTCFNPADASSEIKFSSHIFPYTLADLKVSEFINLTAKDYYIITGKKMNLKEKLSFMFLKKNMKHAVKKNPDLTVGEYLASVGKPVNTVLLIILIVVGVLLILFLIALGSANTWH